MLKYLWIDGLELSATHGIASEKLQLDCFSELVAKSLERRDLVECLHSGAVTARGVPCNCIIAHDNKPLQLAGIQRKELAIVLEENNRFLGNFQSGPLVASGVPLTGRSIRIEDPCAKHGP